MTALPDHESPHDAHAADRSGAPLRLRDRLREQTHVAILDAAEHIITEEGTPLARIDAIAQAAGVSVGTLYNHFADRDALVAAVILDRRRALAGSMAQLVEDTQAAFPAKLLTFFEIFAQAGARHGRFFAVVMSESGGLRSWQCQRDETLSSWFALSRSLLEQGAREGVIRGDRLDAYTTFLMNLARTAVIGPAVSIPLIGTAEMAEFFLNGARASRPNVPVGDGSPL